MEVLQPRLIDRVLSNLKDCFDETMESTELGVMQPDTLQDWFCMML